VSGSDHEPSDSPQQVAQQMREATQRLRDQAWKVSSTGQSGGDNRHSESGDQS
jgi:hypothetical protein